MTIEHYENTPVADTLEARNLASAMTRGARSLCPACGEAPLFESGLQVNSQCGHCDEELLHHRADDFPAYLNIFIVGHVVVAAMMIAYQWQLMNMWALMVVTIVASILISVLAMRPLKGMVVGAQWALRMHGFGGHDEQD